MANIATNMEWGSDPSKVPLVVRREREAEKELQENKTRQQQQKRATSAAAAGDKKQGERSAVGNATEGSLGGSAHAADQHQQQGGSGSEGGGGFAYSKHFLDEQARVHHDSFMKDFRSDMSSYRSQLQNRLLELTGEKEVEKKKLTIAEQRSIEQASKLEALAKKRVEVQERHERLAQKKMEWSESFL